MLGVGALFSAEPVVAGAPNKLGEPSEPDALGGRPPKPNDVEVVFGVPPAPNMLPPDAGLFVVPNRDCPLASPVDAGAPKLKAISRADAWSIGCQGKRRQFRWCASQD